MHTIFRTDSDHDLVAGRSSPDPMLTEISLEAYLDRDNPWTNRLLGDESFQKTRDAAQIEREYDQDLYGKLLQDFESDPRQFRSKVGYPSPRKTVVSLGDRLFEMPYSAFVGIKRSALLSLFDRFEVGGSLCELGSGYGQNHLWLRWMQDRPVYGGEYSRKAVELARRLGLDVVPFDFYSAKDYALIRPGSTVFSCHAIEQIPDARCILEGLKSQRKNIERVLHLEPLHRPDRRGLLGRLRNRYAEINDYNSNLLECLRADPDVEIECVEEDVFGNNPLNPGSFVVWRFR